MAESVIIESSKNKPYSKKTFSLLSPVIVALINVVGSRVAKYISGEYEDKMGEHCYFNLGGLNWNVECPTCREYEAQSVFWERVANALKNFSPALVVVSALCAAGIVAYSVVYLYRRKTKITVTNKRLYGCAAFGKKVDLPLRSIRKVSKGRLKSITVATESDKYVFPGLENHESLHTKISEYLSGRGGGGTPQYFENYDNNYDSVANDFKNFFDEGSEKEEEKDIKKSQNLPF